MTSAARTLAAVRGVVLSHLSRSEARVFLFGSWAEGRQRPTSDIDVAVLPLKPLAPDRLSRLREALEECPVPYPVEVVDLSEADPAFRSKVLRSGKRWRAEGRLRPESAPTPAKRRARRVA